MESIYSSASLRACMLQLMTTAPLHVFEGTVQVPLQQLDLACFTEDCRVNMRARVINAEYRMFSGLWLRQHR